MTHHQYSPAKIKAMYPYMFRDKNLGLSFSYGWIKLFAQLCAEIDVVLGEDKRGFHWVQVKEKFGSMRLHCSYGRNKSSSELDQQKHTIGVLMIAAKDQSDTTCIACGKPGNINDENEYMLVLCDEHIKQRKRGELGNFWFGQNE